MTSGALEDRVHRDVMWVRERFYNYYAMMKPPSDDDIISFYDAEEFDDVEDPIDDVKLKTASDRAKTKEFRVSRIFCGPLFPY